MVELSCRVGTADDDGRRQGLALPARAFGRPGACRRARGRCGGRPRRLPASSPAGAATTPAPGVCAAVRRPSSAAALGVGLGVGTGLGASVAARDGAGGGALARPRRRGAGGCARRRSRQLAGGRPGHVGGDVDRVRRRAAAGGRRGLPPVRQPTPGDRARASGALLAAAAVGFVACLGTVPLRAMVLSGRGLARSSSSTPSRWSSPAGSATPPAPRGPGAVRPGAGPAARGWERRARHPSAATVLVFGSVSTRRDRAVMCAGRRWWRSPRSRWWGTPRPPTARTADGGAGGARAGRGRVVRGRAPVGARDRPPAARRHRPLLGRDGGPVQHGGRGRARTGGRDRHRARTLAARPAGAGVDRLRRAALVPLALVGLVVALGAYNHYRLVPAVVVEDDAVRGASWGTPPPSRP